MKKKGPGTALLAVGGVLLGGGGVWIVFNIILEILHWSIAPTNETALTVYNVFSCGIPVVGILLLLVGVVLLVVKRGQASSPREPATGAGASREVACPSCGAGNPADHAYCDRCGQKLYEEIE